MSKVEPVLRVENLTALTKVALSADGRRVAMAEAERLGVWDTQRGELLFAGDLVDEGPREDRVACIGRRGRQDRVVVRLLDVEVAREER